MRSESIFSEADIKDIFDLSVSRKATLEQREKISNPNELNLCYENLFMYEFKLWKIFESKVAHVTKELHLQQLLAKVREIFGDGYFIARINSKFDELLESFRRFVFDQCAKARSNLRASLHRD